MELKSTQSKSFSIQSIQIEKGKDIKYHQIQNLLKASAYDGVIAGFVLDFRESNTYWINIKDFCEFNDNTTKKSINEQDVIEHNGVLVHKTKLKVNYRYDVRGLIDYIVSTRGQTYAI